MNSPHTVISEARAPQQLRGKARFEKILAEAELLLLAKGISGFSIPELAERLGYTRTSIYHFFPTPYAVLNELSRRYLIKLEGHVEGAVQQLGRLSWPQMVYRITETVAEFHNSNPVGRMLILGAMASDESSKALELTIEHLGRQVEMLMASVNVVLPASNPNARALTVELGTACLRLSYHFHGVITPEYQRESARTMISYLNNFAGSDSLLLP
ncbi:AcrR family transcriptional regulator [Zhongshania antarctica]|uniref:AcrR family transcriptional regulator n=1 Tax=Zhongshania antarctica TaxID=641702 RepID=A0A840R0A5_9GAMM|nr:TetR/AcrR family transcriptional regulator [Zhongshania antarctica]MBB5186004.1 AcrR family transcriptional regulator [Zhongshania antarctica]